jgi:hypothetical protein
MNLFICRLVLLCSTFTLVQRILPVLCVRACCAGDQADVLYTHVNAPRQHLIRSMPVVRLHYWCRVHTALCMSRHQMVFWSAAAPGAASQQQLDACSGSCVCAV